MDDNTIARLMFLAPRLQNPRAFTGPELHEVYEVFNAITGENRKPNGCSACLTAVVTRLKKEIRNLGNI